LTLLVEAVLVEAVLVEAVLVEVVTVEAEVFPVADLEVRVEMVVLPEAEM
jgi:hypothetical protein